MTHELHPADFPRIRPIFTGAKEHVAVLAVLDGNFPGRVFVDGVANPSTAIVWALARWAYIAGDPTAGAFLGSLVRLIQEDIAPASLEMGMPRFELYTPAAPDWMRAVGEALASFRPGVHHESTHVLDPRAFRAREHGCPLPPGAEIKAVDLPIVPEWARTSPWIDDRFKRMRTPGFLLVSEGEVTSRCGTGGFIAGGECMLDVDTFDPHNRCKGFATAVCAAFIAHALDRGECPLWEARLDNAPSRRVAEKLGFVEGESYPVYTVKLGAPPEA